LLHTLAACNATPAPYGECPTGELDGAAVREHGVRPIDPINWLGPCFAHAFPNPNYPKFEVLSTQEQFDQYVAACWNQSMGHEPPVIDWETEEVVGIGVNRDCPADRVIASDFLDCETGSLVVDLDWNRNWCHCDFEAPLIASYVVPKGFVQSMELYDHELSVCEDIVCDCYGGVYDGCTGCDGVL